jgi:hypothetical protein
MSTDLVERLNRLLSEPVRRPEDARKAARAAQALADLLSAAEEAERVLAEASGGHEPVAPGQTLAGRTLQDAAEAVLEEAGRPLHAKELGSRIKTRGWKHPRGTPSRPDQIVYQLAARLPRFPERFRRVAPNTFGLAKWETEGSDGPARGGPKVGLFRGPGGTVGRRIGESPDEPAGASEWRSS